MLNISCGYFSCSLKEMQQKHSAFEVEVFMKTYFEAEIYVGK